MASLSSRFTDAAAARGVAETLACMPDLCEALSELRRVRVCHDSFYSSCDSSDYTLAPAADDGGWFTLTCPSGSGGGGGDADAALRVLALGAAALAALDVGGASSLSDAGLTCGLPPRLASLSLRRCDRLTPGALASAVAARGGSLVALDVSWTRVSDAALATIARSAPGLRVVGAAGTGAGEEALAGARRVARACPRWRIVLACIVPCTPDFCCGSSGCLQRWNIVCVCVCVCLMCLCLCLCLCVYVCVCVWWWWGG